jgi:3-hydroxybutyryl-CoA dehydratase
MDHSMTPLPAAANVQLGSRVSFRKTMTVAEQAMFTGISGNLGPLYVDNVRARAAGAPGMVAFELAVAGLTTTCLWRLAGPSYRIKALDLKFPAPVPVGGTVEASAEIVAIENGQLRCRISCTLDQGGPVVEGEALLSPFADKG